MTRQTTQMVEDERSHLQRLIERGRRRLRNPLERLPRVR